MWCHSTYVTEDILQKQLLSLPHMGLRTEFMSSGLVVSALTTGPSCQAPSHFLGQGLSLDLETTNWLDQLNNEPPRVPQPHLPRASVFTHTYALPCLDLAFMLVLGILTEGFPAQAASTLPLKAPPRPINIPYYISWKLTDCLQHSFFSFCQTNPVTVKNLSWKAEVCFDKQRVLIGWICRNKGSVSNEVFIPLGLWVFGEALLWLEVKTCKASKKYHAAIHTWVLTVSNSWKSKEQHKGTVNPSYHIKHNTAVAGNKASIMC